MTANSRFFSLTILLSVACATAPSSHGSRPSRPVVEFPSESALASIQATPAAPVALEVAELPAATWIIEGGHAASTTFEPWSPGNEGERTLVSLFAGPRPRFTKGMSCVARELGLFYAEHKKPPPESLREFIFGACGTVARDVGMLPFSGPVPATVTDTAVLAAWRAQLAEGFGANIPRDATEVGLWYGRKKGQAYAVAVYDHLEVNVQPFRLVPDAVGDVTVEGEVPGAVEYVTGYINNGRYAADSCFVDPTVARPRFRISCHLADDDPSAWVQLLYAEPRRVLALPFAQFLARRDPAAELAHRPEVYGPAHAVASGEEFARTAFEALNETRQAAGLAPVKLAPAESATAGNLAGHYFAAAVQKKDNDVMNTIALGMLAGWQVGGMIRDASFVSSLVPHTHDAGRWLGDVLATPIGRIALMDPKIEEIALGPTLLSHPDALGAVVTGYRFHHDNDHTADVRRLLFKVAAGRKRLSLSPPQRLAQIDETVSSELARVNQGQQQPWDALNGVLEVGVSRFGANMRGYVVEATSLNAVQIPREILEQPTLQLSIGVTHFKPPGAAWAQMVIVIVYIDHAGQGA